MSIFVATMHDSVYAFDADSNGDASGGLLWKTNVAFLPFAEHRVRRALSSRDLATWTWFPEEGMAGTPVIDPASGTIYIDAFTREVVAGV